MQTESSNQTHWFCLPPLIACLTSSRCMKNKAEQHVYFTYFSVKAYQCCLLLTEVWWGVCMCEREKIRDKEKNVRHNKPCCCPWLGALSSGVIRNGKNLHSEQVNVILMPKWRGAFWEKQELRSSIRKTFPQDCQGFSTQHVHPATLPWSSCHWDE